jgi:hypothetical protein
MATLTISAAARLCHCDRRTLQRAIYAGRLHLDAQHCLSREELIATGYLIVETPQRTPHVSLETPQEAPQGTPVARRPPCSPGRAVPASGSSVALASAQGHTLCAIARRAVGSGTLILLQNNCASQVEEGEAGNALKELDHLRTGIQPILPRVPCLQGGAGHLKPLGALTL